METIIAMPAESHADKMGDDASLQSFRQRPLCVIIWRAAATSPKTTQMIQQSVRHHLSLFFRHSCDAALECKCQVGHRQLHSVAFWPCQAASCHPGLGRHCSWNRKIFVDVTLCGIQSTYRLGRHRHCMTWLMPDRRLAPCVAVVAVVSGGDISCKSYMPRDGLRGKVRYSTA
jgi:hypothetical protein